MPYYPGTSGDDVLNASDGQQESDQMVGFEGNDTLNANDGTDELYGGDGNDTLNGGADNDQLDGEAGADIINGGDGDDAIVLTDYQDTINGGAGTDTLYIDWRGLTGQGGRITMAASTPGMNSWDYGSGFKAITSIEVVATAVWGSAFADLIFLGSGVGSHTINAGNGDDQVFAGGSGTVINGEAGDDSIWITGGGSAHGGAGNDSLNGNWTHVTSDINFNAGTLISGGTLTIGGGSFSGFERFAQNSPYGSELASVFGLRFGSGNDTIDLSASTESLVYVDAGAGNDTIWMASGGYGSILDGAGDDIVHGSSGNDTIGYNPSQALQLQPGNDTYNGNDGDDKIFIGSGDSAHGGAGNDNLMFDFRALLSGITLDLAAVAAGSTFTVAGRTISGFEYTSAESGLSYLTEHNDVLHLSNNHNYGVHAAAGDDIIHGGTGNDRGIQGGAGNDIFYGGAGDDTFSGNEGIDTAYGGAGNDVFDSDDGDTLSGGAGNDTYDLANALANIIEIGGEGTDTIYSNAATYTLPDHVENLRARGSFFEAYNFSRTYTGNALNNTITGGFRNDTLYGLAGDDVLEGGPGDYPTGSGYALSPNTLVGGTGNDTYHISTGSDVVTELASEGVDTVIVGTQSFWIGAHSLPSYTLPNHVENLTLSQRYDVLLGTGNALGNIMIALGSNQTLNGMDGDDRLIQTQGYAPTTLIGGQGNDTYVVVEGSQATLLESFAQGTDTVETTAATFNLPTNIEHLIYTGTGTFTGIGNGLDNQITGGDGNDILSGGDGNDVLTGGNGATQFIGGTGNDVFVVTAILPADAVLNTLFEVAGQGNDEVRTTASIFSLEWYGASEIEKLTLTDNGTHAAVIGNAFNNDITGGTGVDSLFGRAGNDTLRGGTGAANTLIGNEGDDTYVVTAVGDSIIEFAAQGTDTVQTVLASFTLANQVENLTYTGTTAFTGIGNVLGNRMTAGDGAQFLSGLDGNDIITSGNGADELLGGNGGDQFRYIGGETGTDRIYDFASGSDKIMLSNTGFVRTASLAFAQGAAPAANSANSTFLYNSSNGMVSYDADGNGSGAAVVLAQLNAGLSLALSDFAFF